MKLLQAMHVRECGFRQPSVWELSCWNQSIYVSLTYRSRTCDLLMVSHHHTEKFGHYIPKEKKMLKGNYGH